MACRWDPNAAWESLRADATATVGAVCAFERPTAFDLDRPSRRHVGFGRGIHLCLGAHLARLEVRVAVEELLARTSTFELGGPIERPAWPRRGVTRLPLRLC